MMNKKKMSECDEERKNRKGLVTNKKKNDNDNNNNAHGKECDNRERER